MVSYKYKFDQLGNTPPVYMGSEAPMSPQAATQLALLGSMVSICKRLADEVSSIQYCVSVAWVSRRRFNLPSSTQLTQ